MESLCIPTYQHHQRAIECHHYCYLDSYLPLDICLVQNILLLTSFLGFGDKVSFTSEFWHMYLRFPWKHNTFSPFIIAGILNIVASVCVMIVWNYYVVIH